MKNLFLILLFCSISLFSCEKEKEIIEEDISELLRRPGNLINKLFSNDYNSNIFIYSAKEFTGEDRFYVDSKFYDDPNSKNLEREPLDIGNFSIENNSIDKKEGLINHYRLEYANFLKNLWGKEVSIQANGNPDYKFNFDFQIPSDLEIVTKCEGAQLKIGETVYSWISNSYSENELISIVVEWNGAIYGQPDRNDRIINYKIIKASEESYTIDEEILNGIPHLAKVQVTVQQFLM